MYPSFFRFKKLIDHGEIENNIENNENKIENNSSTREKCKENNNDYDTLCITNNLEEFKSLFKTQEKACYELRSENTVLKLKLEMSSEMNNIQNKKIKSLKMKKNKLQIENKLYQKMLYCASPLGYNNSSNNNSFKKIRNQELEENKTSSNIVHSHSHSYPPPPPPPLPLPPLPPPVNNNNKINGNFLMNNVLDELKGKFKKID
jgi:hypothetical protein